MSSTDGQQRSASGAASSSDGTITIGSATVRAGGGRASASVTGFTAFGGLVSASSVSVTCIDGVVTASVSGTPAGAVGRKGTVAHGVRSTNADGSTTIIGMRVTISAVAGTPAAVINVASATCAPVSAPAPTPTSGTTSKPSTGQPTTPPVSRPNSGDPTPPAGQTPSSAATPSAPTPQPNDTYIPVTG